MRTLLTTLMVLAAIFVSTEAFAQEPVQAQEQEQKQSLPEEQQDVKPYKVYCEIVATQKFFSNKSTVELDFGQYAGFWTSDRQLVDEQGNTISFNSALDAANYMARRGWDLEEVFITSTTATPVQVELVKAKLVKRGFKNIHITNANATVTSHCGENCLGILYINDGNESGVYNA